MSLESVSSILPQLYLLFHLAPVMALTAGKADSTSSRSGFMAELLGEESAHSAISMKAALPNNWGHLKQLEYPVLMHYITGQGVEGWALCLFMYWSHWALHGLVQAVLFCISSPNTERSSGASQRMHKMKQWVFESVLLGPCTAQDWAVCLGTLLLLPEHFPQPPHRLDGWERVLDGHRTKGSVGE